MHRSDERYGVWSVEQCSAVQCSAVQCSAVQCSAVWSPQCCTRHPKR
jgi:hypothetical protein